MPSVRRLLRSTRLDKVEQLLRRDRAGEPTSQRRALRESGFDHTQRFDGSNEWPDVSAEDQRALGQRGSAIYDVDDEPSRDELLSQRGAFSAELGELRKQLDQLPKLPGAAPQARLDRFVARERIEARIEDLKSELYLIDSALEAEDARAVISPHVRPATVDEVREAIGREPKDWEVDNFFVATKSFEAEPLYGAAAFNLIVPKRVKVEGDRGHIELFEPDNGAAVRAREVEFQERAEDMDRMHEGESRRDHEHAAAVMMPALRPATVEDYRAWLRGYMAAGNDPTELHDGPFSPGSSRVGGPKGDQPAAEWYVATRDFEAAPLYGASALKIIVPPDVRRLGGELGHSTVFLSDGWRANGDVPVFADTLKVE